MSLASKIQTWDIVYENWRMYYSNKSLVGIYIIYSELMKWLHR